MAAAIGTDGGFGARRFLPTFTFPKPKAETRPAVLGFILQRHIITGNTYEHASESEFRTEETAPVEAAINAFDTPRHTLPSAQSIPK